MKNLTWQNPEQLFVAQELINKVKSKCCGIKDGMSTEQFCIKQGVPYPVFNKWFRDCKKRIVPVEKPTTLKALAILSKYADVLMPREQVSYDYLKESGGGV